MTPDPYACCEGTRRLPPLEPFARALLTRRGFLWTAGKGALALAVLPALSFAGRSARADEEPPRPLRKRTGKRVLVPIFLRGGADGLNMVVPHGDPHYYSLRPTLAIPRPRRGADGSALDLDGFFGLHPALAPLRPLFQREQLAVVQAVSYRGAGRSHFAEQDVWETAATGGSLQAEGWLNRFLAEHRGSGPIRAVSFGTVLPRILRGEVPVQAVRGLDELRLNTGVRRRRQTLGALAKAYQDRGLLPETGQETLAAIEVLGKLKPEGYRPRPGATYPETPLGQQLRQAAQLIKADVGVEVVEVELGGWDTHQNQGGVQGAQATLLANLAGSVRAFITDLGTLADEVLLFTMSEFGRTAHENGTRGTDHGHGNVILAAGSGLAGGQVHGDWPGLAPAELNEKRDLKHTTDFRQVFGEMLAHHMGCPQPQEVLKGYREGARTGLFS